MSETGEAAPARPAKGAAAFRTIGEVAGELNLPAHVLRFWEAKFPQLKPLKRGGGRRYYRPEDVALLRRIKQCLYQDGYTIRGVQRLLAGARDAVARAADPAGAPSLFPLEVGAPDRPAAPPPRRSARRSTAPETRAALDEIRRQLLEARGLVDRLMRRRKAP